MHENPYQAPTSSIFDQAIDQEKVTKVAVAQRRVIFVFLAYILFGTTIGLLKAFQILENESALLLVGTTTLIPLIIFQFVNIYRLADSLDLNPALWLLGMLIPYVNLVVFFRLVHKATTFLKESGVKVGLLGAQL